HLPSAFIVRSVGAAIVLSVAAFLPTSVIVQLPTIFFSVSVAGSLPSERAFSSSATRFSSCLICFSSCSIRFRSSASWGGSAKAAGGDIKPTQVATSARPARKYGFIGPLSLCVDPLTRRTIRISCRGRLQILHAARIQDGGPGQLHPLVR